MSEMSKKVRRRLPEEFKVEHEEIPTRNSKQQVVRISCCLKWGNFLEPGDTLHKRPLKRALAGINDMRAHIDKLEQKLKDRIEQRKE